MYTRVCGSEGEAAGERLFAVVLGAVGGIAVLATGLLWWWSDALIALQFPRFDPETQEIVEYPLPLGSIIRDIWPDQEGRMWFISGWLRNKVGSAEIGGN